MKMENLNDGYVKVYRRAQKKQNDFSTPVNTKSKKDLEFVVELAYKEMSKRDQDDQFAESIGRKLSLKVKTRRYEDVDKAMKIVFIIDKKRAHQLRYALFSNIKLLL